MAAKEQAVTRRSEASELMPPPPLKRIKRPAQVLDEDVYADAVSHIIARDFFPGLMETEAQDEYLSALQSKDKDWINQAGRRLTAVMTPGPGARRSARGTGFTPSRLAASDDTPVMERGAHIGDTPLQSEAGEVQQRVQNVNINMSLGAFQAKYTSEDNESFNELLDKQNHRRTTKYAHFFQGNKIPTTRQLEYRAAKQKQLEGDQGQSQDLVVLNSAGEQRQLYAPGRPSQDLDARPSTVDSFPNNQGPKNAFMFEPDSIEDRLQTGADAAATASKAPPKAIAYSATRFDVLAEQPDRPPSPTMSSIDAAIARRSTAPPSSADFGGAETPRVNGYAFVDAEATPSELGMAVSDEEADAAQQETFRKFLPKADSLEQNPFRIAQQSKREDLHHKLVEKADVERRRGGRENSDLARLGITPRRTPSATPRRTAARMTPAGRSLAAKLSTPRKGW